MNKLASTSAYWMCLYRKSPEINNGTMNTQFPAVVVEECINHTVGVCKARSYLFAWCCKI